MNLSKTELQEMLREMGLKFSPDTSYEELRRMFQDENHRRWLGEHRPEGPKRVIRRRRSAVAAPSEAPAAPATEAASEKEVTPPDDLPDKTAAKTKVRPRRESPSRRPKREKGTPLFIDRHQNVFATVLRRAKHRCELCEAAGSEAGALGFLSPYYLIPLSEGGQEVIKNVVALCPDCLFKLEHQPAPADLKTLKRKARQKVISSVVVVRR
jgi:5-methylcytosine-specific restriction enzyme A